MGQQHPFLSHILSSLVQSILRTFHSQGFSCFLTCSAHIRLVYPDGPKCSLLQCLGYNPQGMERMLPQEYSGTSHWSGDPYCLNIPSANNLTTEN